MLVRDGCLTGIGNSMKAYNESFFNSKCDYRQTLVPLVSLILTDFYLRAANKVNINSGEI